MLRHWFANEDGSTAVEYALLAALFALGAISAYMLLANGIIGLFNKVGTDLTAAAAVN